LEEGIDGMVHVSDMSWTRRINHPGEMLKKGDEVEAIVLDVDVDQQRIALGMKQTQDDPWADVDRKFHIGDIVSGKVTKITAFGAFIELEDAIDGLVHISQIGEEHVEKIKDVLKIGQEVSARVIKIDKDDRRIGLSIKAANYDSAQLQAEIRAYDRIRGNGDRNSAPQTTSTGSDDKGFGSLGDLLDKASF
ncbi:MAG: S1 RNA-binding domain-containing protein, partial [Opitutales bacterium]|nr:S1 RNA-binding domain-containing protein [Opitutales bacterium]